MDVAQDDVEGDVFGEKELRFSASGQRHDVVFSLQHSLDDDANGIVVVNQENSAAAS